MRKTFKKAIAIIGIAIASIVLANELTSTGNDPAAIDPLYSAAFIPPPFGLNDIFRNR